MDNQGYNFRRFLFNSAAACALGGLLLATTACGGGGGGGSNPQAIVPPVLSRQIVYLADQDLDGVSELYSVSDTGGTPIKLSGPLPAGAEISNIALSPDRTMVAYRADQDAVGVDELYVVPVDGSTVAIKVNGPLVAGGGVSSVFKWAPNGSRLAYLADQDSDNVFELYTSIPTGSAGNVKVSGPLVTGGDVDFYHWAPDSSRIAYRADQNTDEKFELYTSLPTGSGDNVKISGSLVANGDVEFDFQWAPNSSRIAYRADQNNNDKLELFTSLPTGSGGNVKVSGSLVSGGDVEFGIQWSPDSNRIAYLADQDTDGIFELYSSAPTNSTANAKLNGNLVSGGSVKFGFNWSPDSSRIAYRANQNNVNRIELYTSPPTSSTGNAKVSGTLIAGGDVEADFQWSPDGGRIAYRADQLSDNVIELFTSPPTSSTGNARVSGVLAAGGNVDTDFLWAPDSSRIAYRADQIADTVVELFTSQPTGNVGNVKINGPLAAGGNVETGFQWAPDSSRISYLADQILDEVIELFSSQALGSDNIQLNSALVADGDVQSFSY